MGDYSSIVDSEEPCHFLLHTFCEGLRVRASDLTRSVSISEDVLFPGTLPKVDPKYITKVKV